MNLRPLALLGLVGVSLLSSTAWSAYDLQNYYPLAQGSTWTYQELGKENGSSRWESEVINQQIIVQEAMNGTTTWRQDSLHGLNDGSPRSDNIVWSEEGLKLYRMEGDICTTPLTLLPRQMEIGEPQQSFANCGDSGATVTHTLQGVENVSVEAGNFSSCLKIRLYLQGSGWSTDETQWLCPNVGKVKATWTDVEGTTTRLNSQELRWAAVGGANYGSGESTVGSIRTMFASGMVHGDSTLELEGLFNDGQSMGARFVLDPDRIFFAYDAGNGSNGRAYPGVSFANAYLKMNGADLTIYDVDVSGAKYLTTWELQTSPEIGFVFKSVSPMPQ